MGVGGRPQFYRMWARWLLAYGVWLLPEQGIKERENQAETILFMMQTLSVLEKQATQSGELGSIFSREEGQRIYGPILKPHHERLLRVA